MSMYNRPALVAPQAEIIMNAVMVNTSQPVVASSTDIAVSESTSKSNKALSKRVAVPTYTSEPTAQSLKKKIHQSTIKPINTVKSRETLTLAKSDNAREKGLNQEVKTVVTSPSVVKSGVNSTQTTHHLTSSPKVLYRIQPHYPERARALGIEGKVKIQFDINDQGRVDNIRIPLTEQKNIFGREIKQAMRKWRYEARASKDLMVTIIFKLDGSTQIQ